MLGNDFAGMLKCVSFNELVKPVQDKAPAELDNVIYNLENGSFNKFSESAFSRTGNDGMLSVAVRFRRRKAEICDAKVIERNIAHLIFINFAYEMLFLSVCLDLQSRI